MYCTLALAERVVIALGLHAAMVELRHDLCHALALPFALSKQAQCCL